jgi:hypothetical protein
LTCVSEDIEVPVVMANNDYPTISSVVKTLYETSTTETAFEASGVTSDALYFTSIS